MQQTILIVLCPIHLHSEELTMKRFLLRASCTSWAKEGKLHTFSPPDSRATVTRLRPICSSDSELALRKRKKMREFSIQFCRVMTQYNDVHIA